VDTHLLRSTNLFYVGPGYSTKMGDRVWVYFAVPDTYFGM